MAQKRMFDKTITNSDEFIEMPDSSQNLYFHLSMNADDDGFVNNWKSIMRMTGHKEDDLKVLISKQFIIPFETGVIVIRHWRINNYLRNDRYTETKFKDEKSQLYTDKNLVYQLYTDGIPRIEENRIEENRIEENRIEENRQEINIYDFIENNYQRSLSSLEITKIDEWEKEFSIDMLKRAIEISVMSRKQSFQYVEGILRNWRSRGFKTLDDINEEQEKIKPDWMDKNIQPNLVSEEEEQKFKEQMEKLRKGEKLCG